MTNIFQNTSKKLVFAILVSTLLVGGAVFYSVETARAIHYDITRECSPAGLTAKTCYTGNIATNNHICKWNDAARGYFWGNDDPRITMCGGANCTDSGGGHARCSSSQPYSDNFESYTANQPVSEPWQAVGGNVSNITNLSTTYLPLFGNALQLNPHASILNIPSYPMLLGKTAFAILNTELLTDASIKTDMLLGGYPAQGPGAGAVARYIDQNNFYAAGVSGDFRGNNRDLSIFKVINGVPILLSQTSFTVDGAIGTIGSLEFKATGTKLEALVNIGGQSLYASASDSALSSGKVGLFGSSAYSEAVTVHFDNISVATGVATAINEDQTSASLPHNDSFDVTLSSGVTAESQLQLVWPKPQSWLLYDAYGGQQNKLPNWNITNLSATYPPLSGNTLQLNPHLSIFDIPLIYSVRLGKTAFAILNTELLTDASIKTDMLLGGYPAQGPGAGAVARYIDQNNFYAAGVSGDFRGNNRDLSIFKVINGVPILLSQTSFTVDGAIGTIGSLEFKATGTKLEALVNIGGQSLYASASDSALSSGKVGLFGSSAYSEEISAHFDNVSVATGDTTPPTAPSTPDLDAASDSGASNADNVTNDNTPTFNGTAEANSTVEIFANGVSLGTALADASGNWSVTVVTALVDGVYNITVTARDAAGNTSLASAALTMVVDIVAPAAPTLISPDNNTIDPPKLAWQTNCSNAPTNAVRIRGKDSDKITILACAPGPNSSEQNYVLPPLPDGTYMWDVSATDSAGNTSGPSETRTFFVSSAVAQTSGDVSGTNYDSTTGILSGTVGAGGSLTTALSDGTSVTMNGPATFMVSSTNVTGTLSVGASVSTRNPLSVPVADYIQKEGIGTVTTSTGEAGSISAVNNTIADSGTMTTANGTSATVAGPAVAVTVNNNIDSTLNLYSTFRLNGMNFEIKILEGELKTKLKKDDIVGRLKFETFTERSARWETLANAGVPTEAIRSLNGLRNAMDRAFYTLTYGTQDILFVPQTGGVETECVSSSSVAGDKCWPLIMDKKIVNSPTEKKLLPINGRLVESSTGATTLDVTGTTETVAFSKVVVDGKDYTGGADLSSKVNAIVLAPLSRRWEARDETVSPNALCKLRAPELDNTGIVKRMTNPYLQSTNSKSGVTTVTCAGVKTVAGSQLDVYEPEEISAVPGMITNVPFMYESSDVAWQVVTAPAAPAGCTMSPGSQEVMVSTDGTLQTKSLVWEITCSETLAAAKSGSLLAVANAAPDPSNRKMGGSHKIKNNVKGSKNSGKTMNLDINTDVKVKGKSKVMKQGTSLWSLIKEALANSPTNEQITNAVKKVAEANDINIPEWGVNNGSTDAKQLLIGSVIDLSPLDELVRG